MAGQVIGYYYDQGRYFRVAIPLDKLTNLRVGDIVRIPKEHTVLSARVDGSLRVGGRADLPSRTLMDCAPSGKESMRVTEFQD